jgi:hypothetical protein
VFYILEWTHLYSKKVILLINLESLVDSPLPEKSDINVFHINPPISGQRDGCGVFAGWPEVGNHLSSLFINNLNVF